MQLSGQVGPFQLIVALELQVAAELLRTLEPHDVHPLEDDVLADAQHRVPLRLGRAEGLAHLALDVLRRIVDEQAALGIALGHLGADRVHAVSALKAGQQGGVHGHRLLHAHLLRRFAGQHVRPALIETGVGHVHVHEY